MSNYFVYHFREGKWMDGYVVSHSQKPTIPEALCTLKGHMEYRWQTDSLIIEVAGDIRIVEAQARTRETDRYY